MAGRGDPLAAGATMRLPVLRALVARLGTSTSILTFTGLSVLMSASITQLLLSLLQPGSARLLRAALWISIGVPLLVVPPITLLMRRLFLRAEAGRQRAEQLATTDALTGLLNRRRFTALGELELRRARRSGHSVAMLLLDIDHFKSVNDTHGHAAGDTVLTSVAECCSERLRPYDTLSRLGGEEFAILLGGVAEASALQVAERVRAGVEALAISLADGAVVRPTVSVGVAVGQGDALSLDSLLDGADRAMYAAKQGGRNRVVAGPGVIAAPQPRRR